MRPPTPASRAFGLTWGRINILTKHRGRRQLLLSSYRSPTLPFTTSRIIPLTLVSHRKRSLGSARVTQPAAGCAFVFCPSTACIKDLVARSPPGSAPPLFSGPLLNLHARSADYIGDEASGLLAVGTQNLIRRISAIGAPAPDLQSRPHESILPFFSR